MSPLFPSTACALFDVRALTVRADDVVVVVTEASAAVTEPALAFRTSCGGAMSEVVTVLLRSLISYS